MTADQASCRSHGRHLGGERRLAARHEVRDQLREEGEVLRVEDVAAGPQRLEELAVLDEHGLLRLVDDDLGLRRQFAVGVAVGEHVWRTVPFQRLDQCQRSSSPLFSKPLLSSLAAPWKKTRERSGGRKKACLVQDISSEARARARTEIQERARRAGRLRTDSIPVWYLQACAATFFTSTPKISRFLTKQKMRLRTFEALASF